MLSLNSYILSKFARHRFPATNSYELITIHYQILATFYLSSSLLFLAILFEIGVWLFSPTVTNHFLFLSGFLCSTMSLVFLYIDRHLISGLVILFFLHFGNYTIGYVLKFPIAAIFGVLNHMNLSYFVTQNNKLLFFHNFVCFLELVFHVKATFGLFGFILTDDLSLQLFVGALGLFMMFSFQSLISVSHKVMYVDLCNKVEVNYERSEDLTKEVVKVIQAKDKFVKSISHEVRNVLDSLNQSVEYLLTVLKDSAYIQVLRNVKISGEILLNLVNNALDAARIRADNLELTYEVADFEPIVRKALIINSQCLKQKNIFAQALIDSNLPSKLLIDSGRLLQMMVNLISNAIKSTPNDGQIYIEASWYGGGQNDTETFLKLIKPKDFRGLRSPLSSDTRETEEEEETGRPSLGVIRRASTSNILEFSFEEESRHQKNLIALGRNSSQKLSVFANSEHWVLKRQKLSGRKASLMNPSITRLGANGQREQFGYLKVQVSDTGNGMDKGSISTVFEVKNMEIGETDLSLWICKQICNKMNGEIICASTVNYGTDYVFYIPVNNAAEENPRQKDKVRALVVDDYDFNRNLHKLLLEKEGVHVTLACDGKEALERYKEKGNDYYDMIMMDINMPIMDGITASKKIREWELLNGYKEAEIVFISGDYFNEDEILENWPKRAGSEIVENIVFMKKPIEIKRIVTIVDKYKNRLHHKPRTLQNI